MQTLLKSIKICRECASLLFGLVLLSSTAGALEPRTELDWDLLGDSQSLPGETNWFEDNARFKIDMAGRVINNLETDMNVLVYWVGLDFHKVVTGPGGDIGTFTLQPYLTYFDRPNSDDVKLVYRIFNFNYTALFHGKLNFKLGHIEIPFGLEHEINTNGTLRNYIHAQNIGVKGDWGVGLNGVLENGHYEITMTRGTGLDWSNRGNPYVFSARFATRRENNYQLGLSYMNGEIQRLSMPGFTENRNRIGIDATYGLGAFTFMGEYSMGENQGMDRSSSIFEMNWTDSSQAWLVYNQLEYFRSESPVRWSSQALNIAGVRYSSSNGLAVSMHWVRSLNNSTSPKVNTLSSQLRYRF